jgi:hypothetical protein
MLEARPIHPPFNIVLTKIEVQEDGLLSVVDHEGRKIAINLSREQYVLFQTSYIMGVQAGASLEREALIFEFTRN